MRRSAHGRLLYGFSTRNVLQLVSTLKQRIYKGAYTKQRRLLVGPEIHLFSFTHQTKANPSRNPMDLTLQRKPIMDDDT